MAREDLAATVAEAAAARALEQREAEVRAARAAAKAAEAERATEKAVEAEQVAARRELEAKLAEAGGAAKEKEEELAALRARVAAADAAAQERAAAGAAAETKALLCARRCFSDLTFKYRGAGAGKVELMLGEDVKEVFDAANQISPEAKAGAKKTKKRTGTATKARKAAAPKKADDGTEKVAMLDGERVKKPSSSYMFFNKARSAELRAADSSMGMGDVSKAVAKAWKEVSDDDKAPFVAQATADKARYEDELSRATVVEQVSKKAAAAAKKRKATDKAAFLGGKKTPKAAAAPSPSKAAAAKAAAKTKAKAAEDAVEDLTEEQLPAEAAVAAALKANALP